MEKSKALRDFAAQKVREIKLWAWAAAVLPITGLAGIFFLWVFGLTTYINASMVTGATVMFGTAVIWWWWALHTMSNLVRRWDDTREDVADVLIHTKEVRELVRDLIREEFDK